MDTGRLKKLVSIGAQSTTRDSLNQQIPSWPIIANGVVWAAVEPANASQHFQAQSAQQVISHVVTIRYRPGILADMIVFLGARRLHIVGVIDVQERHEWLEMTCLEANYE